MALAVSYIPSSLLVAEKQIRRVCGVLLLRDVEAALSRVPILVLRLLRQIGYLLIFPY